MSVISELPATVSSVQNNLFSLNLVQRTQEVAQQGGNARSQDADYSELGQKGGRSQGQEDNPGNFSNRSQEEVEDAARKGGQS